MIMTRALGGLVGMVTDSCPGPGARMSPKLSTREIDTACPARCWRDRLIGPNVATRAFLSGFKVDLGRYSSPDARVSGLLRHHCGALGE